MSNYGDQFAKTDRSPATKIELVTPSDTEEFSVPTRGISMAIAGDIKVTPATVNPTLSGSTVTIPEDALAAGVIHPLRLNKIWSTGTAASGIVAYF